MKSTQQIAKVYDRLASSYDGMYETRRARAENEWVRRHLSEVIRPGGRLLDIGCGTGLGLELSPETSYVGIDISPGMIEEARRKHGDLWPTEFTVLDGWNPDTYLNQYDCVISLFGSPSYVHAVKVARTLRRALLPGGVFTIMPLTEARWRDAGYGVKHRHMWTLCRMQYWQDVMAAAGLHLTEIRGLTRFPNSVVSHRQLSAEPLLWRDPDRYQYLVITGRAPGG